MRRSIAENRAALEKMRRVAIKAVTPQQAGMTYQLWNRLRRDYDFTILELALGVPSATWTGDKYGDSIFYRRDGVFMDSSEGAAWEIRFQHDGRYHLYELSSGKRITDPFNHRAYAEKLVHKLVDRAQSGPPLKSTVSPDRNLDNCPFPFRIPWARARVLDFHTDSEGFIADCQAAIKNPPDEAKRHAVIQALMVSFLNLPPEDQQKLNCIWSEELLRALKL